MKKLLFASIMFATVCFSSVANAQTRSLVVYFSHSGNTESVAQQIKTFTGADILEIIPEKAYPEDYQSAYSGGYPFSISGDIRSLPS